MILTSSDRLIRPLGPTFASFSSRSLSSVPERPLAIVVQEGTKEQQEEEEEAEMRPVVDDDDSGGGDGGGNEDVVCM